MADVSHQETKPSSKMLPASKTLRLSLKRAEAYALKRNHALLQLDHVLLALLEDEDALKVLDSCYVDNESLRQDMLVKVGPEAIQLASDQPSPVLEKGFDEVLLNASLAARQSGRVEISGANVLAAIISSKRGFSVSSILEQHGLTYNNIMRILSGGAPSGTAGEKFLADSHTPPNPGRADLQAMSSAQTAETKEPASQQASKPIEQIAPTKPLSTAASNNVPPSQTVAEPSAMKKEVTLPQTQNPTPAEKMAHLGAKIEAQSVSLNQRLASQTMEAPKSVAMSPPNSTEPQQQAAPAVSKQNKNFTPEPMPVESTYNFGNRQSEVKAAPQPPNMPNQYREQQAALPSQELQPQEPIVAQAQQAVSRQEMAQPAATQQAEAQPVTTPAFHPLNTPPHNEQGKMLGGGQYRTPQNSQNTPLTTEIEQILPSSAKPNNNPAPYPVGEISSPTQAEQRGQGNGGQAHLSGAQPIDPVQYTVQDSQKDNHRGFHPSRRRRADPANTFQVGQDQPVATPSPDERKFQEIAASIKNEQAQQLITPREQFADNIPKQMKIGKVEQIEVRLPRHTEEEIRNSMSRNGNRQAQVSRVSKALTVHLRGSEDMFIIENRSPSTHWVEHASGMIDDNDYAVWRWKVMPTRKGAGILEITSTVRFVDDQVGVGAEMPLSPMKSYEVGIRRNYRNIFSKLLWVLLAVGLGAALMPFAANSMMIFKKLTDLVF